MHRCSSARPGCWAKARDCSNACSMVVSRRWSRTSASIASSAARTSPNCASCSRRSTMTVAELLHALFETTVATSGAVALALLLRRPLRNTFGAAVAYACWLVVPLSAIAVLLPPAAIQLPAQRAFQVIAASSLAYKTATTGVTFAPSPWMFALWLLGILFAVAWFVRQQNQFQRGLGKLRSLADGHQVA